MGARWAASSPAPPLLLLHTVGARSGQRRVNPVMYQKVDGGYAVFASKAGAPVNPDWYHNLLAHPQVTAEIGTQTVELVARVADGDERERIWAAQKAAYPGFADYERKTTRQIPVIVLEPVRLWAAHTAGAEGPGFTSLVEGSPPGMFDLTTHLSTLISPPRQEAELVIPGDQIPADPAAAADFCAEQDEALHGRGLTRTGPWQELPSGAWTATIAPV